MNSNNYEKSKHEKLKKDIENSIEELKKRDEKVLPEKKYTELVKKEQPDKQGGKKEKKKNKINEYVKIAILGLLLTLIVAFIFQWIAFNITQTTEPPVQPVIANGYQAINSIEFKIEDHYIVDDTLFIRLKVSNKSKNNFYTTVRSMHLIDKDGKEYLPNVDKGSIPTNFYGRRIEPQTEVNALIAFDGFTEIGNKLTLVVNNASDAYHFIWDYMITLPEK